MNCEEPPRFFDLRNFGPRVEANEGRNEQFAGDVIPTGRLIELCKWQCSAQLEHSRLLAARDLDGAHQSSFGGRNVRPPLFQEKLAPHPVHLGIEPMLSGLLDRGELRIQSGQCDLDTPRFCLALCE